MLEEYALKQKVFLHRRKKALDFLNNKCKDHKGRSAEDYMNFTEQEMHDTHDWVQWAFPIDTDSLHNPESGLIDHCSRSFSNYGSARVTNRTNLTEKYLESIGIRAMYILKDADVNKFFTAVPTPTDHHMKRISRLLRHHMLTGNEFKARLVLCSILKNLVFPFPQQFSSYTVAYWTAIVYDYYSLPDSD